MKWEQQISNTKYNNNKKQLNHPRMRERKRASVGATPANTNNIGNLTPFLKFATNQIRPMAMKIDARVSLLCIFGIHAMWECAFACQLSLECRMSKLFCTRIHEVNELFSIWTFRCCCYCCHHHRRCQRRWKIKTKPCSYESKCLYFLQFQCKHSIEKKMFIMSTPFWLLFFCMRVHSNTNKLFFSFIYSEYLLIPEESCWFGALIRGNVFASNEQ